jgi:hypothetical protein
VVQLQLLQLQFTEEALASGLAEEPLAGVISEDILSLLIEVLLEDTISE